MKKLIISMVMLNVSMFSTFTFANPENSCDGEQSIFSDYTVKGNKYVAVCYVHDNIRYVFGKDGAKPDVLLNVPKDKVEFTLSGNGDQSVTIPNGAYSYTVGEYLRGGPFIQVWKNKKIISEVELGGKVLENNISDYASTDIESNSNRKNSNKDLFKLSVSGKYRDVAPGRHYFWKYQLISNVDNLKIESITVNRGRCLINENKITYMTRVQEQNMLNRVHYGSKAKRISEDNEVPRTSWDLNYNDVYYFTVSTDSDYGKCKPQEVVIETNQGRSTLTWDL
ncbi:Uncharacterised protein [Serratia fonticola]|uniref:hypothetical protein n=1 Tax=Serratia fonticola TaxID=47917 RepID=UPI00217B1B5E|nr:hypothetical protein [Serratia fonticola]CAI1187368.1 Uncharacterised protein [Serratia fonticola]